MMLEHITAYHIGMIIMNVKKVLNITSWVIFAFGIIWIISGSGTFSTRVDFIMGIGMILVAIFLNFKSSQLPGD